MLAPKLSEVALLLYLTTLAAAHGSSGHGTMDMGGMQDSTNSTIDPLQRGQQSLPSYISLDASTGSVLAHIVLEVIAWFFVLPIGVMFSIARSRLAFPTQFLFLVVNGLGVLFGTIYNANTPDLYENNAHHKIGWIATWVMTAQVVMALLFLYSGRSKPTSVLAHERAAFLPVTLESIAQHNQMHPTDGYSAYRWSGDSGQGTERSSSHQSRDMSPTDPGRYTKPEVEEEHDDNNNDDDDDDDDDDNNKNENDGVVPQGRAFLRNTFVDRYLSQRMPGLVSLRLQRSLEILYEVIDRTILVLGFIALTTGGVTYAGIFRAQNIFSGLAHFIKGGIFFWYGLLTLGRWMGCFAEFGWAWNVKPSRSEVGWKASIPSAEFTESFVIFLYGCTNVFLEHLGGWGGAWSAGDLEHVSISVMFFGGGLCGLLVESTRIRDLLSTTVEILPARNDLHPADARSLRASPQTYHFSMNPMPGLIILLLGIMMSSHQQESMVGTMVHKQWGTLFVGFALARAVTYILFFISPPTSLFASRPPSELVSSFCLVSGGLIFMASAGDIIHLMLVNDLMAMFLFTVCMGLSSFIMAWTIIVLAIRGWAERQQIRQARRY